MTPKASLVMAKRGGRDGVPCEHEFPKACICGGLRNAEEEEVPCASR